MRNLSYLIILLSASILSCRTPRYIHAPAAVNAPILKEAGDSKLAAYYSSNFGNSQEPYNNNTYSKSKGYDLQAAYAITNHWALQASYFKRFEKNEGYSSSISADFASLVYNRKSADAGIGYYTNIGNSENSFFQVFAGGGSGKYKIKDAVLKDSITYNLFHNSTLNKFYLQPGFIFSGDNVAFAVVSRFSFINFRKIDTNYSVDEQAKFNLDGLQNKTLAFWEPAINLNFGFNSLPSLKFELQLGASISIDNNYYDYKTGNASVGLVFDFSKLKKK